MSIKITSHTVVKNEDQWIWYSLMSVLPLVNKMIIYDTGSTDNTVKIIKSIKSPKISFKQILTKTRKDIVKLRQQQISETTTPWFILLDGDEIWPRKNLIKLINAAASADKKLLALFNRTKNCVGDIFHYLPEKKGLYSIKGKTGHLNMRMFRKNKDLRITGEYPLEAFTHKGIPLQQLDDKIKFVDTWYLHTTHLPRSSRPAKEVIDRQKKQKFRLGVKMSKNDLPEVLWIKKPSIVPPPITNRWQALAKLIIPK